MLDDAASWSALGRALIAANDLGGAVAAFDRAVSLGPGDIETVGARANAYGRAGHFVAAMRDYDQVLGARPNDRRARAARGVAALNAGQTDLAIRDFTFLFRERPADTELLYFCGTARLQTQDAADFSAILATTPHEPDALEGRAEPAVLSGNWPSALADLSTALDSRADRELQLRRDQVQALAGNWQAALDDFTITPSSDESALWRAIAAVRNGVDVGQFLSGSALRFGGTPWPGTAFKFLLGGSTADKVRIAAGPKFTATADMVLAAAALATGMCDQAASYLQRAGAASGDEFAGALARAERARMSATLAGNMTAAQCSRPASP